MPFSVTISPHASTIGVNFRLERIELDAVTRCDKLWNCCPFSRFSIHELMLGQRPMPFHRLVKSRKKLYLAILEAILSKCLFSSLLLLKKIEKEIFCNSGLTILCPAHYTYSMMPTWEA
jgi:hypothetical protein